jgi:hypothetical protein
VISREDVALFKCFDIQQVKKDTLHQNHSRDRYGATLQPCEDCTGRT